MTFSAPFHPLQHPRFRHSKLLSSHCLSTAHPPARPPTHPWHFRCLRVPRPSAAVRTLAPYPLSDLARGLLVNWAVGTELPAWATTMLMVDAITFVEADSPQESRLLDAVWAAMTDQPIDDAALDLARQLVSS